MERITKLIKAAEGLKQSELEALSARILEMLNLSNGEGEEIGAPVSGCRRCDSEQIVKFGKDKHGKQRYKCKSCGTIFSATSYTVISKTHQNISVWKKYIELLLQGASLSKSAHICKISVQTAFSWRHKILNALQHDQNERMLGGIIETDETYIGISYKGNHKKSNNFTMPRPAYKRGTDSRAQTGSRACVICAVERNGQVYSEVLGKGQPTIAMLAHAFDERILPESVVISDKSSCTKTYFDTHLPSVQLVRLMAHVRPKSMNSPPEVRGAFHIQNINNCHYRLKKFLERYNGVSTKYLNHYVNLFVWIENHKKLQNVDLNQELTATLTMRNSYVPFHTSATLPAIPTVA